jgi:hypothetical protein
MNFRAWLLREEDIVGLQKAREFQGTLGDVMPQGKVKHSARVARTVFNAVADAQDQKLVNKGRFADLDSHKWTAVMAAIFHDYLERGGDHSVLNQLNLSPDSISVINALTSDKGEEDPLTHMQEVLPQLNQKLRNIVILIKLSDRIDNLRRRMGAGGIGWKYLAKSSSLMNYLFRAYSGDPSNLESLKRHIKKYGIKIQQPSHWR